VSADEYLIYLKNAARAQRFPENQYPNLFAQAKYLEIYGQMDLTDLMNECLKVQYEVEKKLAVGATFMAPNQTGVINHAPTTSN
jgi:hypothetical protein